MSENNLCRMPGCKNDRRNRGELRYPDDPDKVASNGDRYRVGVFGAKFCSTYCETRYEHLTADSREAQRAAVKEIDPLSEPQLSSDGEV